MCRNAESSVTVEVAPVTIGLITELIQAVGTLGLRLVLVVDYLQPGRDIVNLEDLSTMHVDFKAAEVWMGQTSPISPYVGESWLVDSCGVRLFEVGLPNFVSRRSPVRSGSPAPNLTSCVSVAHQAKPLSIDAAGARARVAPVLRDFRGHYPSARLPVSREVFGNHAHARSNIAGGRPRCLPPQGSAAAKRGRMSSKASATEELLTTSDHAATPVFLEAAEDSGTAGAAITADKDKMWCSLCFGRRSFWMLTALLRLN